ncbi:hypothetical protein YC2023_054181 [Brassica napus]
MLSLALLSKVIQQRFASSTLASAHCLFSNALVDSDNVEFVTSSWERRILFDRVEFSCGSN